MGIIPYLAKHDAWYEKFGKTSEGVDQGFVRRATLDV